MLAFWNAARWCIVLLVLVAISPFAALRVVGLILSAVGQGIVKSTDLILDTVIELPGKWERWRARRDVPL